MTDPLTDPNEIRQLLDKVAYGTANISGASCNWSDPYDFTNATVKRAFDVARFRGLSGEDRMTVLAYHALLSLQESMRMNLSATMTTVKAPMFVSLPPKRVP